MREESGFLRRNRRFSQRGYEGNESESDQVQDGERLRLDLISLQELL